MNLKNGGSIDVEKIRGDFPILRRQVRGKPLTYFDNAATTQKPASVLRATADYYEQYNSNVHRGIHTLSEEATARMEEARVKVARFIGAGDPACVLFTRNATEAINLVAYAWGRKNLKPADEILLTEMEHHSNLVPWQILAQEKQAKLRFVPVTPEGRLDLGALPKLLGPKTRIFCFTAMSNALGTINPVAELIQAARAAGVVTLVDASQWVPHRPTDVRALECDFLAFSGHKMLGPTGIGVLWGRRELLESMDPFLGGGDMIREVWLEKAVYNELPYKFEAGTPHIAGAIALGHAVDYLEGVGLEAIGRHERQLVQRALEILGSEPEVKVYGPEGLEERGGLVSFNLEGIHPHDVGTVFDSEGIAIRAGHHCCQPLMKKYGIPGTARASFYLYNTLEEVERLAGALRKVKEFFSVRA